MCIDFMGSCHQQPGRDPTDEVVFSLASSICSAAMREERRGIGGVAPFSEVLSEVVVGEMLPLPSGRCGAALTWC